MCGKTIIICFISFFIVFASAIVTLIILNYVATKPRFYIQEIYIPSLNNPNSSNNATNLNTSIIIDLKFKRVVAFVPLRYIDLNITLYYNSKNSSADAAAVGSAVVPGFPQGRKKIARRRVVVDAAALPWEDALEKISGGSTVKLTAEVATGYMLRRCGEEDCYYTSPKAVEVAADLEVDGSGLGVARNPTRLR